jgi:hypothetical protein
MGRIWTMYREDPRSFAQGMFLAGLLFSGMELYGASKYHYATGDVVAVRELCTLYGIGRQRGPTPVVACGDVEQHRARYPNAYGVPTKLYEFAYTDSYGRVARGYADPMNLGTGTQLGWVAGPSVGDRMSIAISPDVPARPYVATVEAVYKVSPTTVITLLLWLAAAIGWRRARRIDGSTLPQGHPETASTPMPQRAAAQPMTPRGAPKRVARTGVTQPPRGFGVKR